MFLPGRSGIAARGSNLTICTGAAMLPHKEKANKAGEDAFFISDCGRYFGAAAAQLSFDGSPFQAAGVLRAPI